MGREAVILAGGRGTRLKSLVSDRPKSMAPVNGKPFLLYLLNFLARNNFSHVILAVGYKHEIIREYFGERFRNINLSYAIEEKPLGTGGAILNALKLSENPYSFILNGDTYFPVSFDRMETCAGQKKAALIIALRRLDDVSRYGSLSTDKNGRITHFIEKKGEPAPGLINGGIYYLKNSTLLSVTFPQAFSFENDFLAPNVMCQHIYGVVFDTYFIDIGIPETFKQAQADFFTFEDC